MLSGKKIASKLIELNGLYQQPKRFDTCISQKKTKFYFDYLDSLTKKATKYENDSES
jgi:hypothetical protein